MNQNERSSPFKWRRGVLQCVFPLLFVPSPCGVGSVSYMMGALNGSVPLDEAERLFALIEGRVSKRKRYVKVAVMLALSLQTEIGVKYSAGDIAQRATKYVKKNCGINGFEAGATLMLLVRWGYLKKS